MTASSANGWPPTAPRRPTPGAGRPDLTVNELILRYWDVRRGAITSATASPPASWTTSRMPSGTSGRLYGPTPAACSARVALKAVRKAMIDAGLARNTINARVGKIRRMFKWAVADELVPPAVLQGSRPSRGSRPGAAGVQETGRSAPSRPSKSRPSCPTSRPRSGR